LGTVILAVSDRVGIVVDLIKQLGIIGTEVAVLLSRLVPFIATLFVITKMLSPTQDILIGIWKPLGIALCLGVLFLLLGLGSLCFRQHVSFRMIIWKLWPAFLTVIRSGRLDAAYGMTERCCWAQLGIEKEYTKASLPYGLVLYVPVGIAGVLIFTIYAASSQQIELTPLWIVAAILVTIMIYVVTPPLPGVDLLTYIGVFQQLGIDQSAVIAAMVFDILFFLFASAANQSLLQVELVLQAQQYGLLDRDVLRRVK
jgi:Na+/H+-dicarboxylate symporter